ncbi:AmmeMemoRadiSam system protein B [Candidatus Hodarchaeum mangrovi]
MDRISKHAGSWYAGSAQGLKEQIEKLFSSKWGVGESPANIKTAETKLANILGVVSPHAGYIYSGPIASHGYANVYKEFDHLDTVIILGPNHSGIGSPISFYPGGKWHNPFGEVKIDKEAIEFAQSYDFGSIQDRIGFEKYAHSQEHSIDIQLPFLQYRYGNNFQIVPICLMDQSYPTTVKYLANFIKDYIQEQLSKEILVIASSDLSHESNYDLVIKNDKKMLELLESCKLEAANSFRKQVQMTMCGYGPVFTLIQTAIDFGSPKITVLKYANSSDIVGGRSSGSYTVGYSSVLVQCKKGMN